MQGKIIKGIAGFYYVHTTAGLVECKAKGIFRKDKIKPLVGDNVEIELIDKESIFSRGCVSELVSAIFRVMATPDVFAKRNYQKSQQYSLKAITDKRNAFFDLFVNEELSK